MRLLCENLQPFIDDLKHHYSVETGKFTRGKAITLYNDHIECDFKITHILHYAEHTVLRLQKVEGSEYERDVVSSYYAGYNLND